MSKRPSRESPAEMSSSTPEEFRLMMENNFAFFVKMAVSEESPRKFAKRMRSVLDWPYVQTTERTRPLYSQMKILLDEIENEAPRDRVWHPPMSVRPSKAAARADHARFMAKREQVLVLFEKAKFLQRSESILAAQDAFKQAQSTRASKPRKLDEAQCNRIAERYWRAKTTRTGYGVVKELAREYDVSTATITATAKKYKPLN